MATVRRVLIAIVGFLLLLDAAALAYVKFGGGPQPSDEKSKVVFWIDDAGEAGGAEEKLTSMGYEVLLKQATRKTEVPADWRLTIGPQTPEMNQSVAQVLRNSRHTDVHFSSDRTYLYYGPFFPNKADANRLMERIKAQNKIAFQVVQGQKEVDHPSHRVIVMEAPDNFIPDLKNEVNRVAEVVKTDEESLQPAAADQDEEIDLDLDLDLD